MNLEVSRYFKNENALNNFNDIFSFKNSFIAIDEVGRGCVAGPVLSCASFWVSQKSLPKNFVKPKRWLPFIGDSKKLSPKKREQCFSLIQNEYNCKLPDLSQKHNDNMSPLSLFKPPHQHLEFTTEPKIDKTLNIFECVWFSIGDATAKEIDMFNIWNAVQISIARALINLYENTLHFIPNAECLLNSALILMDGKLCVKVPSIFKNNTQVTFVKADDLFVSVGFSSIVAKVWRDNFMKLQENIYPNFGFASHKGYGTKSHLELIQQQGLCQLHRQSFLNHYISNPLF